MSPRTNLVATVIGFVLLIGTPSVLALTGDAEVNTIGEVPQGVDLGVADVPPRTARTTVPVADPGPPPSRGLAPTPPAPPLWLGLAPLGLNVPLVPVGLEPDGTMELPEDVATVGWYELGVRPGEPGTAVLAGHVDSNEQGRGALFDVRRLDLDEQVTVTLEDGQVQRWRVTGRTSYGKDELPTDELFVRGGEVRLALITCGGAFDPATRSYAENVVVLLAPVA